MNNIVKHISGPGCCGQYHLISNLILNLARALLQLSNDECGPADSIKNRFTLGKPESSTPASNTNAKSNHVGSHTTKDSIITYNNVAL